MSEVQEGLQRGRDLAHPGLRPAFEHALVLAKEAEYKAARTAVEYQTDVSVTSFFFVKPAYPPLVELLAEAGRGWL